MSNHTSLSIPILNTQCSTLLMYVNIIIIAETDGSRQISPESPVKPMVGAAVPRKISSTTQEAASNAASIRLTLPPTRIRRTSEPHPRYIDIHSHARTHTHTHTNTVGSVGGVLSCVAAARGSMRLWSPALDISWIFTGHLAGFQSSGKAYECAA